LSEKRVHAHRGTIFAERRADIHTIKR
jgi:hypothetical protein